MIRFLLVATSLALASCSPEHEPRAGDEAPVEAAPGERHPDIGGAPALTPLSGADVESADLSGELACSFARTKGGDPLFIGSGDVDDAAGAEGIAKVDGAAREFAMAGTGGFSQLSQGARFTAAPDIVVAIEITAEEPIAEEPQIAMESPAHRAMLTLRSGEEEAVIEGVYECGP